jgi:hypothetical protein
LALSVIKWPHRSERIQIIGRFTTALPAIDDPSPSEPVEVPIVEQRKSQPQTDMFGPSPTIARPSPTERFHIHLDPLGSAFHNFKLTANREISNAFRPHSSDLESSIYDKFPHNLVGPVSEIFSASPIIVSGQEVLLQRINAAFGDAIRQLFQESDVTASRGREKKLSKLNQLSLLVNELRTSVQGIAHARL